MRRVIIESPYAMSDDAGIARNAAYAHEAMLDSLSRGEAPFASHALYPLVLDDKDPAQRKLGMEAGFAWGEVADLSAVYSDLGVSPGMLEGIRRAELAGRPIEYRWIPAGPKRIMTSGETPS